MAGAGVVVRVSGSVGMSVRMALNTGILGNYREDRRPMETEGQRIQKSIFKLGEAAVRVYPSIIL